MSSTLPRLLLLAGLLVGSPLAAQQVEGEVREQDSGRPVVGSLVVLLDGAGRQIGGALTDDGGRFAVRAPGPGIYRLRAERIGHSTAYSAPFEARAGDTIRRVLELESQPIALEGVIARGERRCRVRPQEGLQTHRVWDEARKALNATAFGETERLFRFRVTRYERDLDPEATRVSREEVRSRSGLSERPFVSLPAEVLVDSGFIQSGPAGTFYYVPDAHVLLSDAFLDTHCFRLEEPRGDSDERLIGLAFEPARRGPRPDVSGTLWLDRETGELRSMDFRYTRLPWSVSSDRVGGHVEFEQLPSGAWIVRRWWLRMPRVGTRESEIRGGGRTEEVLVGLREEGGEIVEVLGREGGRLGAAGALLEGVVYDSISGAPLAGARVYLSGTQHAAETDSAGRFRLEGLPAGEYQVGFLHPLLEWFGAVAPLRTVSLDPERPATVSLVTPPAAEVARAACAREDDAPGGVLLFGTVREVASGAPAPGARVTAEWQGRRAGVTTDSAGAYRICGLPADAAVTVRVSRDRAGSEDFPVLLGPVAAVRQDLAVGEPVAVELRGRVEAEPDAPARNEGRARNVITQAEIEPLLTRVRHVGDVLRALNFSGLDVRDDVATPHSDAPNAGRHSGLCIQYSRVRTGGASCAMVTVVLNGIVLPQPALQLPSIDPAEILEIEFLPPFEAGARYGTAGSAAGVLIIRSR